MTEMLLTNSEQALDDGDATADYAWLGVTADGRRKRQFNRDCSVGNDAAAYDGPRPVRLAGADRMLASIRLHPITDAAIERASRLEPGQVRTLDSIHLEAAIDLHGAGSITTVLTHDEQLANACMHNGISLAIPCGSGPREPLSIRSGRHAAPRYRSRPD